MLLLRALFAFAALPGMVAFVLPWLLVGNAPARHGFVGFAGAVTFGVGVVVLLWCVWAFYANGRGTLAPWSPPKRLVTTGLYRWSRNPMYVGVVLILVGWSLSFASTALALYSLAIALAFQLRVVFGEEPWLARTHGDAWQVYARSVPRWIGPTRDTVDAHLAPVSSAVQAACLAGGCHCGALRVGFETAIEIVRFTPRACDCSFCTRHAAAYVSDPHGKLSITATTAGDALVYRQGSNQAAFLICRHCGVLVGVVCSDAGRMFGAVNVRCLEATGFAEPVAASPQQLDATAKISRWSALWVPDTQLMNIAIS